MKDREKLLMLVLGFGLWAALGYVGKVPLDPLIALLQMGLGGLITTMLQGSPAPLPAAPVPATAQAGFSTTVFLTMLAACAMFLALASLAGCASLTDAGHAAYSFEPTLDAAGRPTGACKFSAADGKEFSSRSIVATSNGVACQVIVQEGASTAFQGQAIAGKALSILPSFAPIMLPPGPATVVPQIQAQPTGPKL